MHTWLVTGAAGFIGARFVESCHARGDRVLAVDRLTHFQERGEHRGLEFGTRVDRDALLRELVDARPEVSGIVHLGACTDTTQLDEHYLTKVNLNYSRTLWTWATDNRVPFVYASSAATYGDGSEGYDDDEAGLKKLEPLNPYGVSKHQFDLWVIEQEARGSTPPYWCGLKFFNVYGFGERHKRTMASVVLQAFDQVLRDGTVRLFRSHRPGVPDGHQKRDFIFVDDVVESLHFALTKPVRRGIFNLGTGHARTFLDLARSVFVTLGQPESIVFIETPPAIRERYQYFTKARMARWMGEGVDVSRFASLEDGVRRYWTRLRRHP